MISQNPIGDQVLWIVRRLSEQKDIQLYTMKELDPFVNRILLALHQSDQHGHGNHHWNDLPPIDLWGALVVVCFVCLFWLFCLFLK